ncbi:MAG: peptidylprolyl isomerase [Marinilabiliaceae bacterium]|nr:peptidylprolyl isomerase [Marinilabiliaceae bacterium]
MITSKYLKLTLLVFLIGSMAGAQDWKEEVLLTVNDSRVSAGEFMWVYRKNNSNTNKSTVDEYLELYTLFKLKVEQAKEEAYHQTESFSRELEGYRKQLAKNYLTDQGIKEELLKNAYERSKEEINVYHILVKCPADAIPSDTIMAYDKAKNIRERIRLGEPFVSVARGASDDPSAMFNGGNLGYLTVFQTPIVFEDAIYSMKPGELSRPVRTSEGYHIIKVQDRRPESGSVKVAHIMKATPPGASKEIINETKSEIDSIYSLLLGGGSFSELARNYSDDKGSALNGGELPWFSTGQMVHEFSEAAFSLLRDEDITLPFRTMYGWHIVKRIDRKAAPGYEEKKNILESKMSQSYLESLGKKSFIDKLKNEYNYKVNSECLDWFYSVADSAFRAGSYRWYEKDIPDNDVFSYAGREVSAKDFADFISKMGKRAFSSDSIEYINRLLDLKSYEDLENYENSILEQKYPEFRYLMNEFHDGILLFEISDKEIWSKTSKDSDELRAYWESRKNEFLTEESIRARIFSIDEKAGKRRTKILVREIRALIKQGADSSSIMLLDDGFNKEFLSYSHNIYKRNENTVIDNIRWHTGTIVFKDSNGTYIVDVENVKEASPLPYDEAISFIIDDYQEMIEKNWVQQLRNKYPVRINKVILNRIKQALADEQDNN